MSQEEELLSAIYENAVDSLRIGMEFFLKEEQNYSSRKHAILTIFHAIELLLKERLAQTDPILIYKNIDARITNDSPTVGIREILARYENMGLGLPKEECAIIGDIQKIRNRIEHHRYDHREKEHEFVIAQSLKFILFFVEDVLKKRIEKGTAELAALARVHTAEALATLVDITNDPEAPGAARVAAANAVLDRGPVSPDRRLSTAATAAERFRSSSTRRTRGRERGGVAGSLGDDGKSLSINAPRTANGCASALSRVVGTFLRAQRDSSRAPLPFFPSSAQRELADPPSPPPASYAGMGEELFGVETLPIISASSKETPMAFSVRQRTVHGLRCLAASIVISKCEGTPNDADIASIAPVAERFRMTQS